MSPVPFEVVSEELDGGILSLTVRGELDLNTAPQLEQPLQQGLSKSGAPIVIDLSECEFIDSTGIALIVRAWQHVDRNGEGNGDGRLVLCCGNEQVQRLLELTGVESSISMFKQKDDAIAALSG